MARSPARDIAARDELAPYVAWDVFLPRFMQTWAPNTDGRAQHMTLVGPTSQGKTTLALALIDERRALRDSHVVIFATKPRDLTLTRLGWPIIRTWPPAYGQTAVIYWPRPRRGSDASATLRFQYRAFRPVLAEIFEDGNRIVYFDEAAYFTQQLRLERELVRYWQMGRSMNLIIVAGTQRPTGVPRAMFSECSWFIAFRTADEDELRRVSEIGGVDTRTLREIMRSLAPHEFVACQTRTGKMVRSKVSA